VNIDEKLVNIKEQLTELQEDFIRIFGKNLEHIATEAIKDKAIHFKDTEISRIKKNIPTICPPGICENNCGKTSNTNAGP